MMSLQKIVTQTQEYKYEDKNKQKTSTVHTAMINQFFSVAKIKTKVEQQAKPQESASNNTTKK